MRTDKQNVWITKQNVERRELNVERKQRGRNYDNTALEWDFCNVKICLNLCQEKAYSPLSICQDAEQSGDFKCRSVRRLPTKSYRYK